MAHIRSSAVPEWAESPFVAIHTKVRFVAHESKARLICQKINPVVKGGIVLFNLSQGSEAQYLLPSLNRHDHTLAINNLFSSDRFVVKSEANENLALGFY